MGNCESSIRSACQFFHILCSFTIHFAKQKFTIENMKRATVNCQFASLVNFFHILCVHSLFTLRSKNSLLTFKQCNGIIKKSPIPILSMSGNYNSHIGIFFLNFFYCIGPGRDICISQIPFTSFKFL